MYERGADAPRNIVLVLELNGESAVGTRHVTRRHGAAVPVLHAFDEM
jgi:hypothetical protein